MPLNLKGLLGSSVVVVSGTGADASSNPANTTDGSTIFPALSDATLTTAANASDIDSTAVAVLSKQYTLSQVRDLWEAGHITSKTFYAVVAHELPPTSVSVKQVYGTKIYTPVISAIADPAGTTGHADDQVATYTNVSGTFVVNVPANYDIELHKPAPVLAPDQDLPAEFGTGVLGLSIELANHVIGDLKSDNSRDHTFSYKVRAEVTAGALAQIAANTFYFLPAATLVRT